MYQKAIKGKAIAEFLIDQVLEDYKPIKFDFPDEDLMAISHDKEESSEKTYSKLYFDRASNILGHDISAVLITLKGEYCIFMAKLDFNCTNNVTE